jgi:hypothetical protein
MLRGRAWLFSDEIYRGLEFDPRRACLRPVTCLSVPSPWVACPAYGPGGCAPLAGASGQGRCVTASRSGGTIPSAPVRPASAGPDRAAAGRRGAHRPQPPARAREPDPGRAFFDRWSAVFRWNRPQAGVSGPGRPAPWVCSGPCERLVAEQGVLLLPPPALVTATGTFVLVSGGAASRGPGAVGRYLERSEGTVRRV